MKSAALPLPAIGTEGDTRRMSRTPRAARVLSCVLASFMVWLPPLSALANPAGGVVHSGAATISGQGSAVVDVNQASANAVLSWQSFNIKPGETTNFHQPGASAIAGAGVPQSLRRPPVRNRTLSAPSRPACASRRRP